VEIDEEDLPPDARFYLAKALHVTAYACWAALTAGLPVARSRRLALLPLLCVHAGATELLQLMIPPRSGSWRDALLNLAGLGIGVLLTRTRWLPARAATSQL
jgi:VanZ family protein